MAKLYRLCCPIASANPLALTPGSMSPFFGFEAGFASQPCLGAWRQVYQSSSHSIGWGFEPWGSWVIKLGTSKLGNDFLDGGF